MSSTEKSAWMAGETESLDDETLHRRIEEAGALSRLWFRRFAGLVFLAYRRDLPRQRGFKDIYEYAARMAGASRAKVDEIIRIGCALEKTTRLKDLFLRGEIGWSKLRVILKVVTPETDEDWATQVQRLSKRALEALVQDRRREEASAQERAQPTLLSWDSDAPNRVFPPAGPSTQLSQDRSQISQDRSQSSQDRSQSSQDRSQSSQDRSQSSQDRAQSSQDRAQGTPPREPPAQPKQRSRVTVDLDGILADKVAFVQGELSRSEGRRLSFRETLDRMVTAYQGEPDRPSKYLQVVVKDATSDKSYVRTTQGDVEVDEGELVGRERVGEPIVMSRSREHTGDDGESSIEDGRDPVDSPQDRRTRSRHIPVSIQRQVLARDGGLCQFPGCRRLGSVSHHTRRFGLDSRHDPSTIRTLCEPHHQLVHAGLVENEDDEPARWHLSVPGAKAREDARTRIDRRYQEHHTANQNQVLAV